MYGWAGLLRQIVRKQTRVPVQTKEQVREYLSQERIDCLLCGRRFKMLNTHLPRVHWFRRRRATSYRSRNDWRTSLRNGPRRGWPRRTRRSAASHRSTRSTGRPRSWHKGAFGP